MQLEHEGGIPRNPFINAGAIVTTDSIIAGHAPKETIGEILRFVRELSGDSSILIDPVVAAEETATGYRNFALANFLRAYGNLHHSPEMTLGVYFHHCAIAMTCLQLASAGRFLANAGRAPTSHVRRSTMRLNGCRAILTSRLLQALESGAQCRYHAFPEWVDIGANASARSKVAFAFTASTPIHRP